LFLFKKSLHVLAFIVLIVVLALAVSPSKTDSSFIQQHESSITEVKTYSASLGVFVNINQATNFNHFNQTVVDYIFVALIALFLLCVVNYQCFTPSTLPPPWYIVLRHKSRIYISAFKVSNLQYTAQLTCQH